MSYYPDQTLFDLATELGQILKRQSFTLATAESCTGGWIAETITEVPGSSNWFERGFVTYSNQAKQEMLGVRAQTLETQGAVSQQTALEMAEGALLNSPANLSLAVTGIAGPDGGSADKPVGTVWIAYGIMLNVNNSLTRIVHAESYLFSGNRYMIRKKTVSTAITTLINILKSINYA